MTTALKHAVSKKKRRFQKDGFDLDLAYILDNVIAMGFPSSGTEALYRNSWTKTKKFLDTNHPGHYRLYNLCSEREYDHDKFDGNVVKFGFDDHNPPALQLIIDCCKNLEEFLKDEENVAAIHCKAGKGRTGVIICCWLVHCKYMPEADNAMKFYGAARTHDQQGVTIPSQRRFVRYYEHVVKNGGIPTPVKRQLKSIHFSHVPAGGFTPTIKAFYDGEGGGDWPPAQTHEYKHPEKIKEKENPDGFTLNLEGEEIFCHGNSRFEVWSGKEKNLMHFWLHSGFLEDSYTIPKGRIDDARKDKKHKKYPEDFSVTIEFVSIDDKDRPVFPNKAKLADVLSGKQYEKDSSSSAASSSSKKTTSSSKATTSSSSSSSSSSSKKKTPKKKRRDTKLQKNEQKESTQNNNNDNDDDELSKPKRKQSSKRMKKKKKKPTAETTD